MLLEAGRVVEIGEPDRIGQRYLDLNFSQEARAEHEAGRFEHETAPPEPAHSVDHDAADDEAAPARSGDGAAEVVELWMQDFDGRPCEIVQNGADVTAVMRVLFREAADDPLFGVLVEDDLMRPVVDMNNLNAPPSGHFEPGDLVTVAFAFPAVMAQGRHWLTGTVAHAGTGEHVMDRHERVASVVVHVDVPTIGIASTPYSVRVERAPERVP